MRRTAPHTIEDVGITVHVASHLSRVQVSTQLCVDSRWLGRVKLAIACTTYLQYLCRAYLPVCRKRNVGLCGGIQKCSSAVAAACNALSTTSLVARKLLGASFSLVRKCTGKPLLQWLRCGARHGGEFETASYAKAYSPRTRLRLWEHSERGSCLKREGGVM